MLRIATHSRVSLRNNESQIASQWTESLRGRRYVADEKSDKVDKDASGMDEHDGAESPVQAVLNLQTPWVCSQKIPEDFESVFLRASDSPSRRTNHGWSTVFCFFDPCVG